MINHARTLLLNLPVTVVSGISDIYIPSEFIPQLLSTELKSAERIIFPSDYDSSDRVSLVNRLIPIMHCPEIHPYTLTFDDRITYIENDYVSTVYKDEVVDTSISDLCERILLNSSSLKIDLFSWNKYSEDMQALRDAWDGKEGLLRVGAFLMSYVYQIEKLRQTA